MSKQAESKAKTAAKTTGNGKKSLLRELVFIIMVVLAVLILMSLISFNASDSAVLLKAGNNNKSANFIGGFGAYLADYLLLFFGYIAYLVPILLIRLGWIIVNGGNNGQDEFNYAGLFLQLSGLLAFFISCCGLASLHFGVTVDNFPSGTRASAGGAVGLLISDGAISTLSIIGSTVVLLALFCISLLLFWRFSWLGLIDALGAFGLRLSEWSYAKFNLYLQSYRRHRQELSSKKAQRQELLAVQQQASAPARSEAVIEPRRSGLESSAVGREPVLVAPAEPPRLSKRARQEQQLQLFTDQGSGNLPPLALLPDAKKQQVGYSKQALQMLSKLLEVKLGEFGVQATVVHIQSGPVVTRFEIDPEPGTKSSKITGLTRDLARSMSVDSLRVVEVISGKSTIGIEIPNELREIISLKEMMQSAEFADSKSPLTICLGKDVGGKAVCADICKMPHLLVAGTTGSGKSVGLHAILLSILYKASPHEVRFILIDPKMLELIMYEDIGHMLCPVVTDMDNAMSALRWCVMEMDRRYALMSKLGVRQLSSFNKKVRDMQAAGTPLLDPLYDASKAFDPSAAAPALSELPLIVVVIDEYADMNSMVGKKAEALVVRLAQKARAAGIHLILATQRPSVDVITGLIKANVPTRIAFQVSSKVDSRTILDQMGAEQLLGNGDMLYYQAGVTTVPERVHGAFVDAEVKLVVDFWRKQGKPQYIDEVLESDKTGFDGGVDGIDSDAECDPLYDKAVQIVIESGKGSISYLQRRLGVGYNRAANMIEMMQDQGIVGEPEKGAGSSRAVLVPSANREN